MPNQKGGLGRMLNLREERGKMMLSQKEELGLTRSRKEGLGRMPNLRVELELKQSPREELGPKLNPKGELGRMQSPREGLERMPNQRGALGLKQSPRGPAAQRLYEQHYFASLQVFIL